jgi:hypothetical protein
MAASQPVARKGVGGGDREKADAQREHQKIQHGVLLQGQEDGREARIESSLRAEGRL